MKNKIIEMFDKKDKALAWEEIRDNLGLTTSEEEQELSNALQSLTEEYSLYFTKHHKYIRFEDSHIKNNTIKGVFEMTNSEYGFVKVEGRNEDIFVHSSNSKGAIQDDIVLVELIKSNKEKNEEGRIVKILERKEANHVGTIEIDDNKVYVKLDNRKYRDRLYIRDETKRGLVEGNKVVVRLLNEKDNDLSATVVKNIGHVNDPQIDILSVAYEHGFDPEFSEETIEELKNIKDYISEEEINNRLKNGGKDLRDEVIFTIDGDDTKDIDDAISIEKLDNNTYKLGVHIADVSYYVKENTSLNSDAVNRGTSVYLADTVLPMLPHQLSNGICSLNPNLDRFALSCVMSINDKGEVKDYEIFPSVIKSRIQMTYKKVNDILEKNIIDEKHTEYVEKLKLMHELSKILGKMKELRGSIDFDTDEAKIITDEKGKAIDIKKRVIGTGEKIIEDFMIAANETVASSIFYMDLPCIYRIHETPDREKITEFLTFLSSLGYTNNSNLKSITPKAIQELLNSLKDKKEYRILSNQMLRCMKKAIYDSKNVGHFGIASKCYSHFTSPIRRLPDLILHRVVRSYLFEHKIDEETINYYQKTIPELAYQASIKEKESVECEREVEDMKMAEYMEGHIGETFQGMISSVTNFGLFVQLDNLVEGLVRVEDMKGYYNYDEKTCTLRGKSNSDIYRLGDILEVEVISASSIERKIDFKIIKRVDVNENSKEESQKGQN